MRKFIDDNKYAIGTLFEGLNREKKELRGLYNELKTKEENLTHLQFDFKTYDMIDEYNDVMLQHKYIQMAKFADEANLPELRNEISELSLTIKNRSTSFKTIGMSILQIAKQAISIKHSRLNNCPNGRNIGPENLKNIIWQARNQAIHFEEQSYSNQVKKCFANLHQEFGETYNLNAPHDSLSINVITEVLGWNNFTEFESDLISLN